MNRDNALYLVIGALAGFICGYVMHEVMAAHQPAPRRPGEAAASAGAPQAGSGPAMGQAGSGPATQQAGPGPAMQQAGPGPAMQQVQELRARVENDPTDAEAVRLLANLNYDISNWSRSASLYQQYLELDPGNVDVMVDLGAVLRHLEQPQKALEQFREVRRLAPDHWQSLYNEVLVLAFDLTDQPAADSALAELLEMQPDNPDVVRLVAEVSKRARNE